MSQYFSFYLAKKNEDGKFSYVAPFKVNNGEFRPYSLLTRSRSFIDYEEFEELATEKIAVEDMDEYLIKFGTHTGFGDKDTKLSHLYAIPVDNMIGAVGNAGVYQGYVNKSEFKYIKERHYFIESRWEVDLVDAEIQAESPNPDLVKVSFTAYNDTGYYANILHNAVDEVLPWDEEEKSKYYFVFDTEY